MYLGLGVLFVLNYLLFCFSITDHVWTATDLLKCCLSFSPYHKWSFRLLSADSFCRVSIGPPQATQFLFHFLLCTQDPSSWDDVLKSARIRGSCKTPRCEGDTAVLAIETVLKCVFSLGWAVKQYSNWHHLLILMCQTEYRVGSCNKIFFLLLHLLKIWIRNKQCL